MLDDKTAAEIAHMLTNLMRMPSEYTGPFSQLDEITSKWARVHPELAEKQREFSQARAMWWPSDPRRNSPMNYTRLLATGMRLAELMVKWGDERLTLCGRPSVYSGACRGVKLADGTCSYGPDSHTDTTEGTVP